MPDSRSVLVVQTAFLGDVILTLPLVQVLKKKFPSHSIDILVTPQAAPLLANHPAIRDVIMYDKRGTDSGIGGFIKKLSEVRGRNYDIALVPHRSLRSAALAAMARISLRIGFDKSAGKFLFNKIIHYEKSFHEVQRNLRMLRALDIDWNTIEYPKLYPLEADKQAVDGILSRKGLRETEFIIGVAPGTVWNTKRWLNERYVELVKKLVQEKFHVALIGGLDDAALCEEIASMVSSTNVFTTAGKLSLLQSAEIIRRCSVLVCNDSAPMHLAVAMGTPVVAIFGATIPEFGFAPYGQYDVVVETKGLPCRPCSIHGGDTCPIKTFDCMVNISAETVFSKVLEIVEKVQEAK